MFFLEISSAKTHFKKRQAWIVSPRLLKLVNTVFHLKSQLCRLSYIILMTVNDSAKCQWVYSD